MCMCMGVCVCVEMASLDSPGKPENHEPPSTPTYGIRDVHHCTWLNLKTKFQCYIVDVIDTIIYYFLEKVSLCSLG